MAPPAANARCAGAATGLRGASQGGGGNPPPLPPPRARAVPPDCDPTGFFDSDESDEEGGSPRAAGIVSTHGV